MRLPEAKAYPPTACSKHYAPLKTAIPDRHLGFKRRNPINLIGRLYEVPLKNREQLDYPFGSSTLKVIKNSQPHLTSKKT
jgi:hypothetical protein